MRENFDAPRSLRDVPPAGRGLVVAIVAWSLAWKGASLWRAARNGSKPWFVTLLLTNTLGLLDMVYLFGVGRRPRWERLDDDAVRELTGEPAPEARPQDM